MTELGIKVKELRKSLNLSRSEFAEQIGLSASTVGQIERGSIKRPPMYRLEKIAEVLNAPLRLFTALVVAGIAKVIDYRDRT